MTTWDNLPTFAPYILYVVGLSVAVSCGTFLLLLAAWTVHTYNVYKKYSNLPGPKIKHFYSGHIQLFVEGTRSGERIFGDLLLQWCKEHGPVFVLFVLAKPLVIVCSTDGVKKLIISSQHPKAPDTYNNLHKLFGEPFMGRGLVSEMNHDKWAIRRSIVDPAFSRKFLKQSMAQFNSSSDLMVKRLHSKADGNTTVTILDELNKVTLDVIAKVSFSCELDIMQDEISLFTEAVRITLKAMGALTRSPLIKYSPLKKHRDRRKKARECCRRLRTFGEKCIKERLEAMQRGDEVPEDTLTYIINNTGHLTHEEYNVSNMVDDFVTFFIAGQETTANLLTSLFLELLMNQPEVLYRLKNEVESVMGDKADVAFEDLSKLEYTTAVLKEALRLFPPAGGTTRQTVEDVDIGGLVIPAGSTVLISIYSISRMEEHYSDALKFDPDRFMHQDEHVLFSFLPFSLGPRMCLGKHFAMIEAKVLLCKLLTNFDFSLDQNQSFHMATLGTLKPKDGCKVTLKPRNI